MVCLATVRWLETNFGNSVELKRLCMRLANVCWMIGVKLQVRLERLNKKTQ